MWSETPGVASLLRFAEQGLARLRLPGGLYCFDRSFESPEPRGESVRYSIMVLLGMLRLIDAGREPSVDTEQLHGVIASRREELAIGDLGLLLWAEARMAAPQAGDTLALLESATANSGQVDDLEGMEVAWFAIGASRAAAVGLPATALVERSIGHIQSRKSPNSPLYRHYGRSRGRALLPNFATEIYTLLLAEGVHPSRIHRFGNIMVDSLLTAFDRARNRGTAQSLRLGHRYGLVTLHRPALVGDPNRLVDVIRTLEEVGRLIPLIFPVHPRTRAKIDALGMDIDSASLRLIEPLGYLGFLCLESSANLVLTDSGGIQEETTVLGVPCLTLRENTDRPTTITQGTNSLVGFERSAILEAAERALTDTRAPDSVMLWDGHTAERIVDILAWRAGEASFIPPALTNAASPEFKSSQLEGGAG